MDLEIPDPDVDGWTVVRASGEIDVATAPELRERLTELIDAGTTRLIVDLEDVDFIDSTGLGVLVGSARRARETGGDVRLVCTNPRILKVFQATGLHEVFAIGSTLDETVALEA
jgi:anti-sigma B factor antagonist